MERIGELETLEGSSNGSTLRRKAVLRSVLQLLVSANVLPSLLILSSVLQLLVTANVVPSSLILSI
jgi:hypothetical protein